MKMATEEVDQANPDDVTEYDPLLSLTKGLKCLKYEYSVEQVKASHFIFPSDVDDFKLENLSDFGREVIQNYLHVGIVSDTCEKPYKQYEVLLVNWPSIIPRSVYEDKSRALLNDVKNVPTIIFAVPEKRLNKYMQSRSKIPMDDIIVSTAILTEADHWRLMESKVLYSFFNIVDRTSHATMNREVWKTYPTNSLDTQWKQMLFLCCFNYEISYQVLKMTARNWSRIAQRMVAHEKYKPSSNLIDSEVPQGGIYDLLVLWSRHPALIKDLIEFLEGVNAEDPCWLPLDILKKLKFALIQILYVTKKFACEVCHYATPWKYSLTVHMRTHTGEKRYRCTICNFGFSKSSSLQWHLRSHKAKPSLQCEYKQRVSQRSGKHHAEETFNYKCYSCIALYEDVSPQGKHVVIHAKDKQFQCTICDLSFVTKSDLTKHTKNHNKDKPYDCHICGQQYVYKTHVRTHYKLHTEQTMMCKCCKKAFRYRIFKSYGRCSSQDVHSRLGVIEVEAKELG